VEKASRCVFEVHATSTISSPRDAEQRFLWSAKHEVPQ